MLKRALAQETRSQVIAEKKDEYRNLLSSAGNASKAVRVCLQRYSDRLSEGGFVDQIEKNQVQLAQFQFFEELEKFTKLSTKFEQEQESRVKRVLKCLEVEKTDNEIAELAANEQQFGVLLQREMGTTMSDQVLDRLVDLEGYHQALESLADQMQEIRIQWETLNHIIDSQQEQVDSIVDNIEGTHETVIDGNRQLNSASWYQKASRKLSYVGAGAAAALGLTAAIVI